MPHDLNTTPTADLAAFNTRAREDHQALVKRALKLDVTRGKPCAAQLDLANALLGALDGYIAEDGTECRNYGGGVYGLPEARRLLAPLLGAAPEHTLVATNASLSLMHDTIMYAMLRGVPGGEGPWQAKPVTFLCPVPGYDRHFALTEAFGIKMVPVRLTGEGPDMAEVERLAADPSVKAMWCVPQYANPSGETYSAETVRRLAAMPTGAADFRLIWDNAYAVHDLTAEKIRVANIFAACEAAGNPDRPFVYGSTSKISLAGAGLAAMASSERNLRWFAGNMNTQTIGPDKLNQLRHVRFFRDFDGILAHMNRHRAIIAPKFDAMLHALETHLGGLGIAEWTRPLGGYFISLDVMAGTAKQVVALCKQAGLALVPAGNTFPYGHDPQDRNIRLAPTFPSTGEIAHAIEIIAASARIAASEALLARRNESIA
jgi:aspartate/methionine/tyrosine aminotransferase